MPKIPSKPASLAERLKAKVEKPHAPHMVVVAYAGTGKTFTLIMGVAWAFGHRIWKDIQRNYAQKMNKRNLDKLDSGEITQEEMERRFVDVDQFQIVPSDEQLRIWEGLAESRGQVTTVTYCAFNKTVVQEFSRDWGWLAHLLQERCGVTLNFSTINALGNKTVTQMYGPKEISDDRTGEMLATLHGSTAKQLRKNQGVLFEAVTTLVHYAKINLLGWQGTKLGFHPEEITDGELDDLVEHYGIEVGDRQRRQYYGYVRGILGVSREVEKMIDFNDQNWLPIVNDLLLPKSDLLLVDEGQDLSRCKQEFCLRIGRRIVVVGDTHQAIYGYAGGDIESISRMQSLLGTVPPLLKEGVRVRLKPFAETKQPEQFGECLDVPDNDCVPVALDDQYRDNDALDDGIREVPIDQVEILPTPVEPLRLTVTFRCAQAIVKEAQRYVPDFKAHPSNPKGIVGAYDTTNFYPKVKDGDMILSRVNAPLIGYALRFMRQKRKAVVRGREFGKSLVSFVERFKAESILDLKVQIVTWQQKEVEKENNAVKPNETRIAAICDRVACILMFIQGCKTVDEVIDKIWLVFSGKLCPTCQRNFSEQADECPDCKTLLIYPKGITLSTVHGVKGLENDRVFLLCTKEAPIPYPFMAKLPWQVEQEDHLAYVGITRAKRELYWVYSPPEADEEY